MTRVTIDAGLLQMITNGLRRDVADGKVIRGEWLAEIEKDAELEQNTFPLNPNGASKWAHLQKHDGAEAIGVVFRTGSGSVGSLVDGRVVWADWLAHPNGSKPESVNAELLEALKGMVDAHAIPSSYCKERSVYDQARAAIARAESDIESSPKPATFPAMKAAFRTTRVVAGEFIMAFKFRDIEDMDRADDEWRAAMAIETPAKASPCAGHAAQLDADETTKRSSGLFKCWICLDTGFIPKAAVLPEPLDVKCPNGCKPKKGGAA